MFCDFSCLLYLAAWEDKLLVGGSAGAPACVICGANPRSASAVCNSGGNKAVFHAATEEVVVNAKDVLAWMWENVSSIGNYVRFA